MTASYTRSAGEGTVEPVPAAEQELRGLARRVDGLSAKHQETIKIQETPAIVHTIR